MSEVKYELSISRIFAAPRAAVRTAFTDHASLTAWSGPAGLDLPSVAWPGPADSEQLDGEGQLPGIPAGSAAPGRLHLEFYAEPRGRTRLELWEGPFTEWQEVTAREWWDHAFGRLDSFLE